MEPFPKYPCQGRYKESGEVDKMDEVDEEEDGKIFLTLGECCYIFFLVFSDCFVQFQNFKLKY